MTGRPTEYTDELADYILSEMASGRSLRDICRQDDMPARSSVQLWVIKGRAGDERYKSFSGQYAQAVEMRAHEMFDEMFEIADDGSNDWMERAGADGAVGYQLNGEHVQRSKLRIDTRKWALARMDRRSFGEQIQQDHTSSDGSMTPKEFSPEEAARRLAFSLAKLANGIKEGGEGG